MGRREDTAQVARPRVALLALWCLRDLLQLSLQLQARAFGAPGLTAWRWLRARARITEGREAAGVQDPAPIGRTGEEQDRPSSEVRPCLPRAPGCSALRRRRHEWEHADGAASSHTRRHRLAKPPLWQPWPVIRAVRSPSRGVLSVRLPKGPAYSTDNAGSERR